MSVRPSSTASGGAFIFPPNRVPNNHHQRRSPSPNRWLPSNSSMANQHGRTRSISEVIRSGRRRAQSVTAGEVVETLKAPVSWKLIVLCLIWYLASALSNTSSKQILNSFPRPVTLTIIQFAFVSSWCILLSLVARFVPVLGRSIPGLQYGLRYPSRAVIGTTAPLAFFQVGGHIASSIATQKIAVSLVHTIKGMSPLFTVFAYRFLFGIHYTTATYLSLIPLTLGVMLACSVEFRGNFLGVIMAFVGALIFVSQNIFSKKLFNESSSTAADPTVPIHRRKLDKLNLLCYSSGQAFLLTVPLWLYTEGGKLITEYLETGAIALLEQPGKHGEAPLSGRGLILEFIFMGTVHFGQNIIAFVLLSLVSPVTYSVASLIKRIFVIVMAIAWFGSSTSNVQTIGIGLTFLGLYLYDRAGDAARGEKRARAEQLKNMEPLLPLNTSSSTARGSLDGHVQFTESPAIMKSPLGAVMEKAIEATHGDSHSASWLAPGTRQEDTWNRQRETKVEG
ncbi:triose-phosphate transporter family-domain-containing protein [Geopyxis carbonaria]|nr:triose-phosphate transporter family-domain-containing protein [Geopyxis carbonaria]